jgi:outer membrane protein assembly factor BamB
MSPADIGTLDSMLNGGDGYLYIGTSAGALCRLDPKTAEVAYLGKPDPALRMPGLILGNNGLLYCGTGGEGDTKLFAYDRESAKFIELGRVYDPGINDSSFILHHITEAADRTIYTGETDNPRRSGYLWECKVEL